MAVAYRTFKREDRVIIYNPFDEAITQRVEGQEYQIQGNSKAELPGYMATLFVKTLVDKEMLKTKEGQLNLHNPKNRREFEDKVILHVKSVAAPKKSDTPGGVIDVTSEESETNVEPKDEEPKEEDAFEDVNETSERLENLKEQNESDLDDMLADAAGKGEKELDAVPNEAKKRFGGEGDDLDDKTVDDITEEETE